jgi:hypothetical protein
MDFDLPELTPETAQGALCQVKVGDIKPTQNAVSFDEVNDKIREGDVLIGNLPAEHEKDIIDEAMQLARSPEASGMPGYLGPG